MKFPFVAVTSESAPVAKSREESRPVVLTAEPPKTVMPPPLSARIAVAPSPPVVSVRALALPMLPPFRA
ncbi:MAG: hypothetical protein WDM81_02525 [Rhizomicrobium sp.]